MLNIKSSQIESSPHLRPQHKFGIVVTRVGKQSSRDCSLIVSHDALTDCGIFCLVHLGVLKCVGNVSNLKETRRNQRQEVV